MSEMDELRAEWRQFRRELAWVNTGLGIRYRWQRARRWVSRLVRWR